MIAPANVPQFVSNFAVSLVIVLLRLFRSAGNLCCVLARSIFAFKLWSSEAKHKKTGSVVFVNGENVALLLVCWLKLRKMHPRSAFFNLRVDLMSRSMEAFHNTNIKRESRNVIYSHSRGLMTSPIRLLPSEKSILMLSKSTKCPPAAMIKADTTEEPKNSFGRLFFCLNLINWNLWDFERQSRCWCKNKWTRECRWCATNV